jgi:hypothetical protein
MKKHFKKEARVIAAASLAIAGGAFAQTEASAATSEATPAAAPATTPVTAPANGAPLPAKPIVAEPSPNQIPTMPADNAPAPADGLSAGALAPGAASPVQAGTPPAAANSTPADVQHQTLVKAALLKAFPPTPVVAGTEARELPQGITVDLRMGNAVLTGSVPNQRLKDDAGARAAAIVGGPQNVDNHILVK